MGNYNAPRRRPNSNSRGGKRRRRANKKGKIVILLAEVLVLAIAAIALIFVIKATGKKTGVTRYEIHEEDIEVNSETKEYFEEHAEEFSNYTNIALFGVDARNGSLEKGNRTDTIIIASVNNNTGDTKLISVYRDTYLNIGNDTYNKCNSAYAKGGPQQAINMLNQNLDLYITDFVTVGFEGVIKTVDSLGGITIDVQSSEIDHLNNYQASMWATEDNPKITKNYTPVTSPGVQTLNGLQALAYCRIRYTAGDDFRRTERQRMVIAQILEKAKGSDPATLTRIVGDVMPSVATSLDSTAILELVSNVTKYNITVSDGFPFAEYRATGTIGAKGSCVVPKDLEKNVIKLQEVLYPEIEYTPSQDVINFSQKVQKDTSPYT